MTVEELAVKIKELIEESGKDVNAFVTVSKLDERSFVNSSTYTCGDLHTLAQTLSRSFDKLPKLITAMTMYELDKVASNFIPNKH
jgi:hypothetical protein